MVEGELKISSLSHDEAKKAAELLRKSIDGGYSGSISHGCELRGNLQTIHTFTITKKGKMEQ